ncbi:MAG: DUF3333 domain-containing protein [Rhodospirillales bacterium]|nr:DUF3333 domain-containing protein [Rhodospirillales bacterium]
MTAATTTTTFVRPRLDVTSDAAKARIRARYRAEARFRAYGIISLLLTTVFVGVLLVDIVRRGVPAFFQHNLVLDVKLAPDAFGPAGQPPTTAAIRGADYFPILRDALKTAIPGIEARGQERTLTRLLSSGAQDILREKLVANPGLVGSTLKVPLLLSDDADLYFKGFGTGILSRAPRGIATPSGTSGEITILTSANDFTEELQTIKRALTERATQLDANLVRLRRSRDPANVPRVTTLEAEIADLKRRAAASAGKSSSTVCCRACWSRSTAASSRRRS